MVAVTDANASSDPAGESDLDLLGDDRLLDLRPRARRTDAAAVIDEERRRAPPPPAANQALREWAAPTQTSGTAASGGAGTGAGTALAMCAVCGTRPARSTCRNCGRGACTTDTWAMLGLCKSCVNASGAAPGGGKA